MKFQNVFVGDTLHASNQNPKPPTDMGNTETPKVEYR